MTQQRPVVLCLGTLDTKGPETAALAEGIRRRGCDTIVLDCGILGGPVGITPDITREEVALAGGTDIDSLRHAGSRGAAVEGMLGGIRALGRRLHEEGGIHGVVALGGAEGSVLAAATMTHLPVGLPKLLVSPIASGRRIFEPFIGTRDVTVMHSVVDILGLNSIATVIFDNASAGIAGMAQAFHERSHAGGAPGHGPQVAATMLGNTTLPLMRIRDALAESGEELVLFHANGVGGEAMEQVLAPEQFLGVIDFTLSELAGEVAGGFHACTGCDRLCEAVRLGVPQIIVPGCVDFTVHGPVEDLPPGKRDRPSHYHNPKFTLVRLDQEEQCEVARRMVQRLRPATGPTKVLMPLGGLSVPDVPGGEFRDQETTDAFRALLRKGFDGSEVEYMEIDAHINDAAFADAVLAAWKTLGAARVGGP